jgi:hypothetical protein
MLHLLLKRDNRQRGLFKFELNKVVNYLYLGNIECFL